MTPPPMNRRQALGAFGAVSLTGLLAACGSGDETAGSVTTTDGATATVETKTTTTAATKLTAAQFDSAANCRVATELTECPYYFDVDAIRSDIREDREGTLLRLGVRVREAAGCEPIENAIVPRQGDAADDPVLHDEAMDDVVFARQPYSEDDGRDKGRRSLRLPTQLKLRATTTP